ncbi:hypothetical protein J437_LFUL003267 [Ladona fulva]|uniref:Peptidase S1 domain-containing protein n=1 Tax=Ladona fulva TaxID=123851 RepID=A0A8K0JTA4_LADFU|nr:hypothetical protein J437_LFUL003267 [Ladona fulva]
MLKTRSCCFLHSRSFKMMFQQVFLFAATIIAVSYGKATREALTDSSLDNLPQGEPHLLGGEIVTDRFFPSVVSVRVKGTHVCGGVILHQYTVLTAAQCVHGVFAGHVTIVEGSNLLDEGGVTHNVYSLFIHEDYDAGDSWKNDIAIIWLISPIAFRWGTLPVNLPQIGEDIPVETVATAVGWGNNESGGNFSNELRKVEIPIFDLELCNKTYHPYSLNVYEGEICAEGESSVGICDNMFDERPLVSDVFDVLKTEEGELLKKFSIEGLTEEVRVLKKLPLIKRRMKLFYVVVLATALGYSQGAPKPNPKANEPFIVGGTVVEGREFPSVVSIRVNSSHFCGGSILNNEWIFTAAHCMELARSLEAKSPGGVVNSPYTVAVGSNRADEGIEHQVLSIVSHEHFSEQTALNDIALMKVSPPIQFGDGVEEANVPEPHEETPAGKRATVIGWGFIKVGGPSSMDLLKVDVNVASYDFCNSSYEGVIHETHICAGGEEEGKGSCNGDSGGPLYVDNKVVGIVSWGQLCAVKGYPTVFTKVAEYIDWIQEHAK